jgi:hypothetical protein
MPRNPPPLDLATLPQRSLEELRALWRAHLGRAKPPSLRRMLIRELAWRVQAREHGGLDARTQKLLKQAMRDGLRDLASRRSASRKILTAADASSDHNAAEEPAASSSQHGASPRRRMSVQPCPDLPPGTRLLRTWNGRRHEVVLRDGGRCAYQGREFGSLSEVARQITGTRWSGPRFFGVTSRARPRAGATDEDRPEPARPSGTPLRRSVAHQPKGGGQHPGRGGG